MSEINQYVIYYIADQQKAGKNVLNTNVHPLFPDNKAIADNQKQIVTQYIESTHQPHNVLETFVEITDHKKSSKWNQLRSAIRLCKSRNAKLIIAELGTLTSNESFSTILLESGIEFHCCDQPFVNLTILEALCKHAKVHRKRHGELIKQGLKLTSAKSGNPNAAKVISEVNKPKIDTAIIFAHLLQPIIKDYKDSGFSQRQMVKTLNEEGFTAPEGGKWVLSQLQKVLDRVRLNEISMELSDALKQYKQDDLSLTEIAQDLNQKGHKAMKKGGWDETQVKKLLNRVEQINEINNINKFIIDLLPIVHEFRSRNLSTVEMLSKIEKSGIEITENSTAA